MKVPGIGLLICSLVGCRIDGHYYFPDGPSSGEALWVKQLGSEESDYGKSIAIDSNQDLIAVGGFRRKIGAEPELVSNGEDDIYVVKLASSTGSVIWAKRLGGTLLDAVFAVAAD